MSRKLFRRRGAMVRLIDRFRGEMDAPMRCLFDAGSSGRMVCDLDGRIVCANATLAEFAGKAVDLAAGSPAAAVFARDKRVQAWQEIFPVLAGLAVPHSFVSRLEGENALVVEVFPTKIVESDGSISGLILRFADITGQRHLEAQLAQSQKMQAVGQLAGGIAHDFNNLLTAVMGAAEDIAARETTDLATQEDITQIKSSVERGAALVRQLLAFGRQQTLQPRVVAINQAIAELSALLRRLLGGKVRLELDLEQPGREVRVDPVQLDQVLINLAVNARDAIWQAGQDQGKLILRSGHALLLRPLVRGQETIPPGRYVVIDVEDTGAGIPPDVLPRIFDPFFTTKRERGGNGLGLSTVHGIVRQSEGFLLVESEIGRGSIFRIYLPRFEGAIALGLVALEPAALEPAALGPAASPAIAAAPAQDRRRTVMIVEDEDEVRRLAVRQFTRQGWQVLAAEDGEAARDLLDERPGQPLDLVVSDVVMPGLDGPALIKLLRAMRPGLPAILVSGYADEALRRELAGQDIVFMPKPYSLRSLTEAARAAAG